jgi:RimJ/RimL family protein N-acetyltransferase
VEPARDPEGALSPAAMKLKDGRTGTVRRAVPEDAAALTEIVNEVGSEGRYIIRDRATWTLEEERRTLSDANGRDRVFFVVEVGGRVVGLLTLSRGTWPKNAHVAELAMSCRGEFRGAGVGTALLTRAVDWARSVGVRKLTLGVFATNDRAMALYRKMGFAEEARLRGQFVIEGKPVDDVLMARWL